jgi:exopolysaccharide biosynthesis polyprenyl glycosylphosphotransferase
MNLAESSFANNERILPKARLRRRSSRILNILRLSIAQRKLILTIVDLMLVNAVLVVTLVLRTKLVDWAPPLVSDFKWSAIFLSNPLWFVAQSVVWLVWAHVFDCYDLARAARMTRILPASAAAALVSAVTYTFIPVFTPSLQSRGLILIFIGLMVTASAGWRTLCAQLFGQSWSRQLALVVGTGQAGRQLAAASKMALGDANPFRGTGYQVVGLVGDLPTKPPNNAHSVRILGDVSQLVRLVHDHGVDEIVVAGDDKGVVSLGAQDVLLDCREIGLQVNSLATVYERLTGRLPVEYARRDVNLILGPADNLTAHVYATLKRLMDIVLSLFGLVVLVQVIPLVALANALWSQGPLFYRQQRVGKGGRSFALLKFRSMIPDAEQECGVVWCSDEDPRITPVGKLLRKTRLDELPQLLNVLRGEMSIVGPRPERPRFVGQLDRVLPLYRARHAVTPGLTGWAQVHYEYGNSIEDARIKLEYDLYYVRHASLYLDLLTMLQTVRVVLGGMGQ